MNQLYHKILSLLYYKINFYLFFVCFVNHKGEELWIYLSRLAITNNLLK